MSFKGVEDDFFKKRMNALKNQNFGFHICLFFISILSMSSLIYKVTNPVYKGLSAVVVLCICLTLLLNWKRIEIDKKVPRFIWALWGSHLVATLVNRSGHLLGNMVEIFFMITYILLFTMVVKVSSRSWFRLDCRNGFQIVSFSSAIFAFCSLLIFRVLILFKIGERSYYYGVWMDAREGIVNLNASAIFLISA